MAFLSRSACIPLARFVPSSRGWVGRPSKDRWAIASAFVAKAVYGFSLTRQLLDALASDTQLRRICGWEKASQVPHESTFSRAVAIPLSTMSTQRVTYLYELSDSAYDAREITENSREHNHVPITDPNNRGRSQSVIAPGAPKRELSPAEAEHYQERTIVERVNARLKDEFGGRNVRVRGGQSDGASDVRSVSADGRSAYETGVVLDRNRGSLCNAK